MTAESEHVEGDGQVGLALPKYSALADSELMAWDGREFAEQLVNKAKLFGQYILNRKHYELEQLDPEDRRLRLAEWNRRHAWLEWWLGVVPPSKQLVALPDQEIGLKVRVAQQVVDEIKHQRIFSKHAARFGGSPRFESLVPPPTLKGMYDATVVFSDPLDIAASLQVTGEAVLLGHVDPEESIVPLIVDEAIREEVRTEIQPEEVRHVQNGRDVIAKWADSAAKRRQCCHIQDEKLRILVKHYTVDHALLGAHLKAEVPEI